MQRDTVIFDLGGVLLDWNPEYLYSQLFEDQTEMEEFLATICTRDWHKAHDLGVDTHQSCLELARKHPAHTNMIMAWSTRGEEMISGQIEGTVEILAELRAAGVACYALSNMEPDRYLLRLERFPFMRWFDGCVISGQEAVAKPDRKIFEILLERFGLDPAGTVFIDDTAPNVAAAGELGLVGLRFESPERLRADLKNLGLPV
jgi:2-haloacid dehalogenase